MPLGQLTHMPSRVTNNPFHALLVNFSRYKAGSFEVLFDIETILLKYSWVGLILLCGAVFLPLEEYSLTAGPVRFLTILYPFFFIWSLTRLSGVELLQMMLEGRWTAELLAAPMTSRHLVDGFITPLWMVIRQYFLITLFSLALYALETTVLVYDETEGWLMGDLVRSLLLYYGLFYGAVSWTVFVYLSRLLTEVRLRNGLLKGLATLGLFAGGLGVFVFYLVLLIFYREYIISTPILALLFCMMSAVLAGCIVVYVFLAKHFRRYLYGQLDLDELIYDQADPHASAWQELAS